MELSLKCQFAFRPSDTISAAFETSLSNMDQLPWKGPLFRPLSVLPAEVCDNPLAIVKSNHPGGPLIDTYPENKSSGQ